MTTRTVEEPSQVQLRRPAGAGMGGALVAEWIRIRSLTSTWWALIAGAVVSVGMGLTFGFEFRDEPTPIWSAGELAIIPVQLAVLVVVALSVTSDYTTGAIRSTLQRVPRRGILLLARTAVAVLVAATAGAVLAAVADVAAWVMLGTSAETSGLDVARSLASVAGVLAAGAILTVGIGFLTRSTAGTLTGVLLLLLVLPLMLKVMGIDLDAPWLAAVGRHLPGYAAASLLSAHGVEMDAVTAALVLGGWTATAMGLGAWSLLGRDAA